MKHCRTRNIGRNRRNFCSNCERSAGQLSSKMSKFEVKLLLVFRSRMICNVKLGYLYYIQNTG